MGKFPVSAPTEPIPGVIMIDDAFETFQLKVEDPPAIIGFGVTENRLIVGTAAVVVGRVEDEGRVVGRVDDEVLEPFEPVEPVVPAGVDDDGELAGFEVAPVDGIFTVIQLFNPRNTIVNSRNMVR
ncbi:MAG: hypothetical protein ABSG90_03335 [Dehalococcoidia bacterium]|jgi:hypothetical protein